MGCAPHLKAWKTLDSTPAGAADVKNGKIGWFQRVRGQILDLCLDWWLVELLSCGLALICIGITIALLASHNGKPLPSPSPLGISLNAWLSVLSAITKLAIAVPVEEALAAQKQLWFSRADKPRPLLDFEQFDDAARGPLGAIQMLTRTRTRSWASIGGIICLLSLALDPFFQQLISLPVRPSTNNPGTVPRLTRLQSTKLFIDNGTEWAGYNGGMDMALGTFFIGIHELELANTTYFCSSDQCTWPEFETLAVCSQCNPIDDLLQFGCAPEPGDWRRELTQVTAGSRANDLNRTSCGWFFNLTSEAPMLMSGYSIPDGSNTTLADDALVMRTLNLRDPLSNELFWGSNLSFPELSAPITNFAIVNGRDIQAVYEHQRPHAYNCAMQWCVKTIDASFRNGVFTERVVSTFKNETQFSDPLVVTQLEDYLDYIYTNDIVIRSPKTGLTFSVSNNSALSTRFTMDNWTPSYLTQSNGSDLQWLRYMNGFMPADGGFNTGIRNSEKAQWMPLGRETEAVEDMAWAMTTVIRNSKGIAEDVLGTGSPQVFVEVQWPWLTFPVFVLTLTFAFLALSMWEMSRRKRVWRASTLTALVHGLSWDGKDAFRNAASMRDIRNKAEKLEVYLNMEKEAGTLDAELKERYRGTWDEKFVARYVVRQTGA